MLVLTQAGIGGIWFECASRLSSAISIPNQRFLSAALIFGGLAASIFHLGRPLQAWRAFIGVRRSWLSREIVAFNALALGVLLHLAAGVLPGFSSSEYGSAVLVFCSLTGAAALLSSMMVYIDTPREFWRWTQTVPRFLGTTLLLGTAITAIFKSGDARLYGLIAALSLGKLALELTILRNLSAEKQTALQRTAKLMVADLAKGTAFRFGSLALVALLSGGIFFWNSNVPIWAASLLFVALLASELAERSLFFRAVAQPKMPGGPS
jgi:formate dehydrogenase iron-sulfur subunit